MLSRYALKHRVGSSLTCVRAAPRRWRGQGTIRSGCRPQDAGVLSDSRLGTQWHVSGEEADRPGRAERAIVASVLARLVEVETCAGKRVARGLPVWTDVAVREDTAAWGAESSAIDQAASPLRATVPRQLQQAHAVQCVVQLALYMRAEIVPMVVVVVVVVVATASIFVAAAAAAIVGSSSGGGGTEHNSSRLEKP